MGSKIESELLNFREAAALMGISVRSFHALRAEPWLPAPIVLSARLLRWRKQELLDALAAKAPRQTSRNEPRQLASARGAAVSAAAPGVAPRAKSEPAAA
jgi:predicted DNA-binding transcriptional regulator AlpA